MRGAGWEGGCSEAADAVNFAMPSTALTAMMQGAGGSKRSAAAISPVFPTTAMQPDGSTIPNQRRAPLSLSKCS